MEVRTRHPQVVLHQRHQSHRELKSVLFYDYGENAERDEAMLQYFTRKVQVEAAG